MTEDVRMSEGIRVSILQMIARPWPVSHVNLAAAVVVTVLFGTLSAQAQTQPDRAVDLFTCKDVMREPNASREVAIAFLHGYLLGKSGISKFSVDVMERQTDAFIEQCLDNPQSKAVDVMSKLKG
jgi:hypothetical protein